MRPRRSTSAIRAPGRAPLTWTCSTLPRATERRGGGGGQGEREQEREGEGPWHGADSLTPGALASARDHVRARPRGLARRLVLGAAARAAGAARPRRGRRRPPGRGSRRRPRCLRGHDRREPGRRRGRRGRRRPLPQRAGRAARRRAPPGARDRLPRRVRAGRGREHERPVPQLARADPPLPRAPAAGRAGALALARRGGRDARAVPRPRAAGRALGVRAAASPGADDAARAPSGRAAARAGRLDRVLAATRASTRSGCGGWRASGSASSPWSWRPGTSR